MKDRVKKIMEKEGLNPASFADMLDINRQTMIATLSRNKTASINIVMAIFEKFPDINSDWLLFGKGPMYKGEKHYLQPSLFENTEIIAPEETRNNKYAKESEHKVPETKEQTVHIEKDIITKTEEKKIDKIVIFYTDKTFITLTPEE